MLKPSKVDVKGYDPKPAAFRRLCVETASPSRRQTKPLSPAAFRRLCVETAYNARRQDVGAPAAFRRLCVETASWSRRAVGKAPAAFRRLCVETPENLKLVQEAIEPSRLQAAVC